MPQYQGIWNLQQAAQALTSQQWVTDPNFKNTTLLLQADNAANGAQNNTFLDSSSNAFAITRNGNTTQGSFTPFSQAPGYWGNYFDGTSGQYLNAPANTVFNFGTGDFTVEAWVYPTSTTITRPIIEIRTAGTSATGFAFLSQSGATTLNVYINSAFVGASTNSLTTNAWNHAALTRSGNTWTYWINGVSSGTFTNSSTQSDGGTTGPKIGGSTTVGEIWIGYISNARITKGGALYTSNFTPSTTPLTTTVSAGTVSLLTCQSNRFVDNGTANAGSGFTITVNGTPSVQAFSPFAPQYQWTSSVIGGSGYFDGSASTYLTTPASGQFAPAGNFTIACWFYISSLAAQRHILGNYAAAAAGNWLAEVTTGGTLQVFLDGSTLRLSATGIVAGQWYYMTITRTGTTITGQLNGANFNGTATYTLSGTFGLSNQAIWIGVRNGGTNPMLGYIAGIQLIDGSAVTTVPSVPPTAVAGTNLLLNFTNAGIYDATMENDLQTVGDAKISTAVVKYGSGSMYFDGSGDVLNVQAPAVQTGNLGSGNFTVEGWVYPIALGSSNCFVGSYTSLSTGHWIWYSGSGTTLSLYGSGTPTLSMTLTLNTWQHIAWVKNNGTSTFYLNGVSVASASDTNTYSGANFLTVGAYNGTTGSWNGYMDDVRITKGVARYTGTFTPPQVALPRQ